MAVEKKISELTAKSTEIQPLDLLEISEWNGATFDTKSISGEKLILHTKVSLTAAQIKTGNSVPVTLIAAPGSGKIIDVTRCTFKYNYGTAIFDAASPNIFLTVDTATNSILFAPSILTLTATSFCQMSLSTTTIINVENKALTFTTNNDSTVGDSTIDLYIDYRIITL